MKYLTIARLVIIVLLLIFIFVQLGWCEAKSGDMSPPKQIALTFDDGPRPGVLEKLLPLLKQYKTEATFFVIGAVAMEHKNWLRQIVAEGHEIENHSYGHENMKKLFAKEGLLKIFVSIEKTAVVIYQATGHTTHFFRPPYWEIPQEVAIEIQKQLDHKVMLLENPDINCLDYEDVAKGRSAEILINRIKKLISAREKQKKFRHVLVFHELPPTIEALKVLIPYFLERGYEFVRLDKMFLN